MIKPFETYFEVMKSFDITDATEHTLPGPLENLLNLKSGLDHGVGHFRPLSLTRQRHLLVYHGTAMSPEGLCQVF
jgi:hypothetical protein